MILGVVCQDLGYMYAKFTRNRSNFFNYCFSANVTVTVEIINDDVNRLCGVVTSSPESMSVDVECQTINSRRPWGYGIKVTASFPNQEVGRMNVCDLNGHGQSHMGRFIVTV